MKPALQLVSPPSYFLARKSRPNVFHLSECLGLRVQ
jgi:hypothetical protein